MKDLRLELNMTQPEFAKFLGISNGMASHIETGARKLSPKRCIEIEKRTGIKRCRLRPDLWECEREIVA